MCLWLAADIYWICCGTYTTDVYLIKILLLCPCFLTSPDLIIMKGLGNCFIELFSSNSLGSSFGGIYTEHTIIILWRVADIATACLFVFSVILL